MSTPNVKTNIVNVSSPSGNTDIESLPSTPTTVRIEHKIDTSGNRGSATGRFLGGVSRPVVLVVGILLFLSMGGVGFLLDQFLRVPGLKREIKNLEEQVISLETQIGRLEGAVDELAVENDRYENLNVELNGTVQDLSTINSQLNSSNTEFSLLNDRLDESNAQLADLNLELINRTMEFQEQNENLLTLVDFINETSSALDGTLRNITMTLATQIKTSRQLTLGNYEVLDMQKRANWDCDFHDYFSGDNFTINRNIPIGSESYPDVLAYVQARLLDELCIDTANWELYMVSEVIPSGVIHEMTTANLIKGVQRYTAWALDFLYPDATDEASIGITWDEWADAGFRCSNLERAYFWEG